MIKSKSRFILFLLIIASLAYWSFLKHKQPIPEVSSREVEARLELFQTAKKLQRIWNEGEESAEWIQIQKDCLNKYHIKTKFDESQLRCRPLLIQCVADFFRPKFFHLKRIKDKSFLFLSKADTAYRDLVLPGFLFRVSDLEDKYSLDILLEDTCHEVLLPSGTYGYGELPKKNEEEFSFDTEGRKIYLDKQLVTNADYLIFKNVPESEWGKRGDELFSPATNLTLKEMELYCHSRGKELMSALYFDAASFLRENGKRKSAFYWTPHARPLARTCQNYFAKECLDQGPFVMNQIAPSWLGLHDVMGGVLEVMKNPVEPKKNLKLSSFYFPLMSSAHLLGVRGEWDGEGFDRRHFEFFSEEVDKRATYFQVGFRCMREAM